jgi:hypothetical protein
MHKNNSYQPAVVNFDTLYFWGIASIKQIQLQKIKGIEWC